MIQLATQLLSGVFPIIDKMVVDKDEAARIKAELQMQGIAQMTAVLEAQKSTLVAEISGESWLQRNWRPLTMLVFVALVTAYWLGFTAPNISENTVSDLLDIIKVGLGGYVVGRSAEKVVKEWKK